ncbi:MAG: palindromic element RPE5 domain-containing protein [Rickettsia endosymbiont of Pentastiridius leporinus]
MEKSNRSVSRGAERTKVREYSRSYKDIVANLRGSSSILDAICNVNNYKLKDILKIKKRKREVKGGFDNKMVLEKITN